MSKLLGVAPICDTLEAEKSKASADARLKADKREFNSKVKSGDTVDDTMMGQKTMNRRDPPMQERQRLACPYWLEGTRKGNVSSTSNLSQLSLKNGLSEYEQKEGFDRAERCTAKGELRCQ